ncbi:unnamed protein product [Rodentolepis nana]|uniref:dTMP kinase n=1 Tax=Rodentolepis nana TaxID=102285 RepID=A0A0R3TAE6_RODNA|nr:unnamed protein product [Rodentolepis nana]
MNSRKGLFIVLEGTDRVGKSTQANLLADALSSIYGNDTYLIRFPDRTTTIGESLSKYLSGKVELNPHAVHLLFTANRWERAADIEQALSAGRCVVADRYSYSGIVYTASKVHAHTPSWDWCLRSEEELPQPDLVLCLLPDHIDDLSSRGGFGEERFDNASFQTRVLDNFRRLADELESRRARGNKATPLWRWINVRDASISEVRQMVLKEVEENTTLKTSSQC